jgi:predicted cupin superfamily sugar epimerase
MTAQYWVSAYKMQAHPEGGYYAEMYRAAEQIPKEALPGRFSGSRSFSTAIYFLLETHHVSALHRIQSDEVWHFYAGRSLHVYVISPAGELSIIRLGNNPEQGEVFQAVVAAGSWFGSRPVQDASADELPPYSLVGCTVAPGFDFADFELATQATMRQDFPQHEAAVSFLMSEF